MATAKNIKVGEFLTIGLSEYVKNKFQIVGYLYSEYKIVVFTIDKYIENNRPLLDIGAKSKITYSTKDVKSEIEIEGDIILGEYLDKNTFNKFLKENTSKLTTFIRDTDLFFSIVELKRISNIKICFEEGKLRTYWEIIANSEKRRVKVKDYRWIRYWQYMVKNNEKLVEEKKEYYKEFFNSRETYVVMFRYKNNNYHHERYKKNNDVFWISSINYV